MQTRWPRRGAVVTPAPEDGPQQLGEPRPATAQATQTPRCSFPDALSTACKAEAEQGRREDRAPAAG